MKKYKQIAFFVLIVFFIAVVLFMYYKVFAKDESETKIKIKTISEIKKIDSDFSNMFNLLNNIDYSNYKISYSSSNDKKQDSDNINNSKENSDGINSSKDFGSSKKSSQDETNNQSEDSKNNENIMKTELKNNGVLNNNQDINWNELKNEVELLYGFLYNTTLDLYKITINQDEIINFNKEYDNLTAAVKNENKQEALSRLSILYDYIPKFMSYCSDDENELIILRTKNSIFKAYSILDKEEWDNMKKNISEGANEFTKIVTSIDNQLKGKQYNINKAYIMINELQNAVELKDKEIFLIKYKNLLEELQNI